MVLDKVRAYGQGLRPYPDRRVPDLLRLLVKRPAILAAVNRASGNCSRTFGASP